jgi:hypothetical protein
MRKLLLILAVAVVVPALANAQSSGSYTYNNQGAGLNCVLSSSGNITGGQICQQSCTAAGCGAQTGDCIGSYSAGIKTNSGSGNVFVIRPSMVIGLLTDVTIDKTTQTSSALAGVDVNVSVEPASGQAWPEVYPKAGQYITYDSRYIQISSNLFNALTASCVTTSTTPGAGCFFSFNESTVSAHSFDWIADHLSTGYYTVKSSWKATTAVTGLGKALTCVGPVNLTAQQNKAFSFNTPNEL